MSFNAGGLGAPGVRIRRDLNEQSELWLNVKLAFLVVVCCDIFLTVVLLTSIKTGWWALPILGLLLGFLIGFCGLMFAERLGIRLGRRASFVLGNLWGLGCFTGFGAGYLGRTEVDPAINALGDQIWGAFALDWWWYAAGGLLFVLFAVVVRKWKPVAAFVGAEGVALLVLAADPDQYAEIWRVLSWIGLVYLWPFAAVAMVLAAKALQEIAMPSLEFVMKPFSLEEYRETGWIGLMLPRLFGQREPAEKPTEEIVVELTTHQNGRSSPQIQRPRLPGSPEAREFYRAVHRGESFSLRTASKYGVGRDTFNDKIRDGFVDRGLAEWKNDRHHNLGVNLLAEGELLIEHLALIGTTL